MPISSQALGQTREGPETRAQARRPRARPKRIGSFVTVTEDRDIVPSGRKLSAARKSGAGDKLPRVKMLEDTVAEALVIPEEIRGGDFALKFNAGLAN